MTTQTRFYKIILTMLKITDDPKMVELIAILKKEVDKIK